MSTHRVLQKGKVAAITGGALGIGLAVAHRLVAMGLKVCIADRNETALAQAEAGLVVNVGSKQGITTPPGNPAYNVSKAGVKVYTEALQRELRNRVDTATRSAFAGTGLGLYGSNGTGRRVQTSGCLDHR